MNLRVEEYDKSFSRVLKSEIVELASKLSNSKSRTFTSIIFGLHHGLEYELYSLLSDYEGVLPCEFTTIDAICQIIILIKPTNPESLIKLKPEYSSCLDRLIKFQNDFDNFYKKVIENKMKIEVTDTIIGIMDRIKRLVCRQIREIEFFIDRLDFAIKKGEEFANLISKRNKEDYSIYLERIKEYEKRLLDDYVFYKSL